MNITLVDPDPIDVAVTARTLAAAGYAVSTFASLDGMLRASRGEPPKIVVLELDTVTADIVGKLRARAGAQLYILVLTSKPRAATAGSAFAAGADDYMRKPVRREELLARVAKAVRMQSLIAATCSDDASHSPLGRLKAWKGAELTVCVDVAAMTRAPLDVQETAAAGWTPEYCAQTRLFLPDQELELALLLTTNQASLSATARQMFGGADDPEVHQEVLLEMANLAAGALKRKALTEDVVFTLDLPACVPPAAGIALLEDAVLAKRWFLVARDRCFELRAAIRRRENRVVSVAELREGMVLVGSVRNAAGTLLAAAGTRLTSAMIDRLRAQVSGALSLEVARAAG